MNIFEVLENLFYTLIEYGNILWDFLTTTVSVGSLEINFLVVLGTGTITTLIIWRLVKEFVL